MEPHHVKVEIKTEPVDDYLGKFNENFNDISESNIVLRFLRDENGDYSVLPFIKPEPFFEDDLNELNHNGMIRFVKEEIEPPSCSEVFNDFLLESKLDDGLIGTTNVNNDSPDQEMILNDKANAEILNCKIPPQKQRVCNICDGLNLGTHSVLEEHIFKFHFDDKEARALITKKIWECEFCGYQTLKRTNFTRHLSSHSSKKLKSRLSQINQVDMEDDSVLNLEHALRIRFDCNDCCYKTNDKGSLIKHVRLHKSKNIQPFVCEDCNKNFNERTSLDAHIIKRHSHNKRLVRSITRKIFRCEECSYMDVNKSKIIRHRKRHDKKRNKKKNSYAYLDI